MRIKDALVEATLVGRLNRFMCLVELAGRQERVYLPNSGRLGELLVAGRSVLLAERAGPARKTKYDLVMVSAGEKWVSVDSRVPNEVVYEALQLGWVPEFSGFRKVEREASFGRSRLDFLLSRGDRRCLVEVKSVTLVREGTALFPDAPTLRGTRHLLELVRAKTMGYESAVMFVIQREGAERFSPNAEVDSNFAEALHDAHLHGVSIYAHRCRVSRERIELSDRVPISL